VNQSFDTPHDPAQARRPVPKTCPQDLSPRPVPSPKKRRRDPPGTSYFAAILEGRPPTLTAKSLRFTEVLDWTRPVRDLQPLSTAGRVTPGEALLSLEVLPNPQNSAFCRYLSPLPDSNRRPPPYHGGFGLRRCARNSACWHASMEFGCFSASRALPRRALSFPEKPRALSPKPVPKSLAFDAT
jgi:hypothetical protein